MRVTDLYIVMESQRARSQPANINFGVSLVRTIELHILVSFRWALTTTWFLLFLIAIFVGSSLIVSLFTGAWHWFQRSGALIVSIGAVLSTQRPLGLVLESMIDDRGPSRSLQYADTSNWTDLSELRTCLCGFIMVAMGTLIWAYGDLVGCLLDLSSSCLN